MVESKTRSDYGATTAAAEPLEQRVLVVAPFGCDGAVVRAALSEAGIACVSCACIDEVCSEISRGAAALLLAEEAFSGEGRRRLADTLADQPAWSDLPVIVLISPNTRGHEMSPSGRNIEGTAHVTLLERPMRRPTLVSAVQTAIGARQHQYRLRDELVAQRKIEAALRESSQRLSMAQQAGGVGVFDWDLRTQRVVWSAEMERLFGIPAGSYGGDYASWAKNLDPDDLERLESLFAEWMAGDKPEESWEYRFVRSDGEERWMSGRARLVRDPSGVPVRMVGTNVDITGRNRYEAALQTLNATLEEQVKSRTEVAERRARDLRRLASQLSEAEHNERKRIAGVLHDELQQSILAAKLRVQAVARNHATVNREAIEQVDALLAQCLKTSRNLSTELSPPVLHHGNLADALTWLGDWSCERHGMSVTVSVCEELPRAPEYLRVFLFHSVRELLLNTLKHAREPSARIDLRKENEFLAVQVEDEGKDFDPEDVRETLRSPKGFGLFNIRERLRALGGRLEISATPEGGARFRLLVPMERISEPAAETIQAVPGIGGFQASVVEQTGESDRIQILVVDDHQVVRHSFIGLLNAQPDIAVIGEAADGVEAVQQVEQLRPDVVLMDAQLPAMDGAQATLRIKERHPEIGIVGISAHELEHVRSAMLRAGAAVFLSKDVAVEELIEAVRAAVESNDGTEVGAGRPESTSSQRVPAEPRPPAAPE